MIRSTANSISKVVNLYSLLIEQPTNKLDAGIFY